MWSSVKKDFFLATSWISFHNKCKKKIYIYKERERESSSARMWPPVLQRLNGGLLHSRQECLNSNDPEYVTQDCIWLRKAPSHATRSTRQDGLFGSAGGEGNYMGYIMHSDQHNNNNNNNNNNNKPRAAGAAATTTTTVSIDRSHL